MNMIRQAIGVFVISIVAYLSHPKFGSVPKGSRLARILRSPNYKSGEFQNREPIQSVKPAGRIIKKIITSNKNTPKIPSMHTPLAPLNPKTDLIVWFGHSSYYIQLNGKSILVDPVLSEVSSPVPRFPKAYQGSNVYEPTEIPHINFLFITHDHYDHLDYNTIKVLTFDVAICPLGVGAHLERFGVNKNKIVELDWDEVVQFDGFKIHCLTARHWSRRRYHRNQTLWASFLIETPTSFKVFLGGDGGYGTHFKEIGKMFGPIDLAFLENGQYNENWANVHMKPEETIRAAEDLRAKVLMPVHFAKFSLAPHTWNESIEKTHQLANGRSFRLLTPMIGEVVQLADEHQTFQAWWRTPDPVSRVENVGAQQ
jgi:L-ascorbate metabolism protein UlaG (beta-lactamase superfamily)